MAWAGAFAALLTAAFWDAPRVGCLVGGFVLAALLLRTQEILVRAVLRPKDQMGGLDARLLLVLVLPLKYAVVIGALALMNWAGWIRPGALALGFFLGQLVIVAKVCGWILVKNLGAKR